MVGPKEALASQTVLVKQLNWLQDSASSNIECTVKLRSAHAGIAATVEITSPDTATVHLHEPYSGVTPGQACVMYDDTRVLGGGWITRL